MYYWYKRYILSKDDPSLRFGEINEDVPTEKSGDRFKNDFMNESEKFQLAFIGICSTTTVLVSSFGYVCFQLFKTGSPLVLVMEAKMKPIFKIAAVSAFAGILGGKALLGTSNSK